MRNWITLSESWWSEEDLPKTLQQAADYIAVVNDDILPERLLEVDWSRASDSDCCKLIEYIMVHGDCYPFATALSEKTGWPMLHISDGDGSHYVCQTPDGRLIDFTGYVTPEIIKKRYGFKSVAARVETESGYMDDHSEGVMNRTLSLYFAATRREPLASIFGH